MMKRFFVALVVLSIGTTGLYVADAAASHDLPCADVTFLFARGSGDEPNGREFLALRDKIISRIDNDDLNLNVYELGTEAHGGSQYDALGSVWDFIEGEASWTNPFTGAYRQSVQGGVDEFSSYMSQRRSLCPGEYFVLGGYSQGAQVVGEGLFELDQLTRDRVLSVSLFGDPKLDLPLGDGLWPAACRGQSEPWRRGSVSCTTYGGILEGRNPYLPSDIEDRVGSWCDANNPVCTNNYGKYLLNAAFGTFPDHAEYADEGAEIEEAAQEVASTLNANFPTQQFITTRNFSGWLAERQPQVVFVIDTTGSMSTRLAEAKQVALDRAQDIVECDDPPIDPQVFPSFDPLDLSSYPDSCGSVALIQYRDLGDAFVSEIVQDFTDDASTFSSALSGLSADGGDDIPEALLHALMLAISDLSWEQIPNGQKQAVVLTDAGYHDPDKVGGFTRADVRAAALALDPLNVYPVVQSSLESTYQPLADDTSGKVITDNGSTSAALTEALTAIRRQPFVSLPLSEYFAQAGDPVTFDASNSFDPDSPITAYQWDFDGDGTVDQTTSTATTSHSYSSAFEGIMEVAVQSGDGGVANAMAAVTIGGPGPSTLVPLEPVAASATTASQASTTRTVDLAWTPAPTGPAATAWKVSSSEGVVLTQVAGDTLAVSIGDVPNDVEQLTVTGSNNYGDGPTRFIQLPAIPGPRVSIGDQSGLERDLVTGSVFMPVYLSEPASQPVTIQFFTADQTAVAGVDFVQWGTPQNPRSITIPTGSVQSQINVPVLVDDEAELEETFSVAIQSVTGGSSLASRSVGVGTIVDADILASPNPAITVSSPTVIEGDQGMRSAQFLIHLSRSTTSSLNVSYSTSAGSAIPSQDYWPGLPSALGFAPGQISKTVDILIPPNTTANDLRDFHLDVSLVGGPPFEELSMRGTATILDDD